MEQDHCVERDYCVERLFTVNTARSFLLGTSYAFVGGHAGMRELRSASRLPVIRSLSLVRGVWTLAGGQARMRPLRGASIYRQCRSWSFVGGVRRLCGRRGSYETRRVKIRLKPELQAIVSLDI